VPRLSSFVQWLARHGGLVSSISIEGLPSKANLKTAQELLRLSMQLATRQPHAADHAPAAAIGPPPTAECERQAVLTGRAAAAFTLESVQQQQQQQQQHGLCLRSFSCSLPKAVDMLAVLHLDSLTHIELGLDQATTDSCTLTAVFAKLSSLQQLRLGSISDGQVGRAALSACAQLSKLTSMQFSGRWPRQWREAADGRPHQELSQPVSVALQQLLAQPLPLRELSMELDCRLPVLDMALLTKLTKLDASGSCLPEDTVLPAQLHQLVLQSPCCGTATSLALVTRLQSNQLQHLSLSVEFTQQQQQQQQQQLQLQLAQLPSLQHLALQYFHPATAGATASAWALLPQLRTLEIDFIVNIPSQEQWATILAGLAAATSLTKLRLTADMLNEEEDAFAGSDEEVEPHELTPEVAVSASLTRLTRLKDLCIGSSDEHSTMMAPGDAKALTALTSLTRLELYGAGRGVSNSVATALAFSLPQLQHLELRWCGLQLGTADGMVCLWAIGRLTQLTYLALYATSCENAGVTEQGLMQLTTLCQLRELGVRLKRDGADVTREVLEVFWAAVRQQ
jgi:hypothetical protein